MTRTCGHCARVRLDEPLSRHGFGLCALREPWIYRSLSRPCWFDPPKWAPHPSYTPTASKAEGEAQASPVEAAPEGV